MFRIGEFSRLSRISIRMLRHYNDLELLEPEQVDAFTGYRYYSAAQLQVAARIQALREMGFALCAIKEILRQNDPQCLRNHLAVRLSQVSEDADALHRQQVLIEHALQQYGKEELIMNYSVTLKEIPAREVASVRKVISAYQEEGTLWHLLMEQTASQKLQYATPCYPSAIFHDEGYKESDVDVEIQISVSGKYKDTEQVTFKTVPALTAATVVMKGSYDQVSAVNQAVAKWIAAGGYTMNGPMFNIYHVGPADDSNPENWVTEICFPVVKQ